MVRAQKELEFVHAAKGGDVWLAVMAPKTSYTIVSETSGNCHVMAEQTDSTLLHKHVKNLALDIRDSGSFNVVDYKGIPEHAKLVKKSEFIVKAPDGGIILTTVATTNRLLFTCAPPGWPYLVAAVIAAVSLAGS